jgi:hypothetical protein
MHAAAASRQDASVPWQCGLLERRAACYARVGPPLAAQARADLDAFTRTSPTLEQVLLPAAP